MTPARLAYLRQTATTALAQDTGQTWGPETVLALLDHIAELSAP